MRGFARRILLRGALAAGVALMLAACGQQAPAPASVWDGFRIGLLLPERKTARYDMLDLPAFQLEVRKLCGKCQVVYRNAEGDTARQRAQAEELLDQGVRTLVLDAVNAKEAAAIVTLAKERDVPVVAYDRLAAGPVDYFVTFDAYQVGQAQGKALLQALRERGTLKRGSVVMINGSPADPNAAEFKKGAHSVLDGQVSIGAEYDTPDWSPEQAQQEMARALGELGKDRVVGVYAANDGMAGGAIAALQAQGVVDPLPPVTGQDAELAAIQRVITGEQYMTIHKPIAPEAAVAAQMAVAAAQRQEYPGQTVPRRNATGHTVPSVLLTPTVVTRENVSTVVDVGLYTVPQICVEEYRSACKAVGLLK